jgi:hypothetical protein
MESAQWGKVSPARRLHARCTQVLQGVDATVPIKVSTVPPAPPSAGQSPSPGPATRVAGGTNASSTSAAGGHGRAGHGRLVWILAGGLALALALL